MDLSVLIVDDEPEIAGLIARRIRKESPGFSISVVESAMECLEYLKPNRVDCILSDYQMPGMNGMELLIALRVRGYDVPFIFITAQGSEDVAREAFKNGAYDYFTKESGFAHFARITNSIEQAVRQNRAEQSRLRAEAALLEEKDKLDSMLANIGDAISIQDTEFRVLYQNRAHQELQGDRAGEYCYKAYNNMDTVCDGCPVARCFEDGKPYTLIKSRDIGNGRQYYEIKASALRDSSGRVVSGIESVREVTERMRAEEALRLSEERMFNAQRMAHVGNWELDRVSMRLFWSDEIYRIYGREPGSFVPTFDAVMEAMHPDDLEPFLKSVEAMLAENIPLDMDYRLIRPDGTVRTVHTYGEAAFDREGRPLKEAGTIQDITERKRTEESLQLFRNLLDRSNDAIFVNDPATGRFLFVNEKACNNLGYKRDELLGLRTLDIEEAFRDQSAWNAHVREIKNKGSMVVEGTHMRRDGSSFPVEVSVAYMAMGERDYMVAVARDITERKKSEEALAESERFLASMFASIQDEITVLDMGQNIVRFNPAIARRYACSMPLAGKKCYEAYLGRTEACEGCPSALALKTGEAVSAEMPAGPPGEDAWVDIHSFPLVDADTGRIKGVIEHVRDVTYRKKLERRNADFFAMAAHDLNSPLTAMMGYTEMLGDYANRVGDKEAGDLAARIKKSINKLRRLIDDYLEVSKIESGKFNLNPMAQDISETLLEARDEYAAAIKDKGLVFELHIADGLPRVPIDKKFMLRAITNLLQNAVKFTPQGGRISLRAGHAEGEGGRVLVVELSDTGPGVPKEETEKVFEKYYRSPKGGNTAGTGLGLFIVKSVAEAHGGKVELRSEEGKGSTFRLVLPASSGAV